MLPAYNDIKSRIKEPPIWWDANGVPRYDTFTPELSCDIYAHEVALVKIACQDCHEHFMVEFNWNESHGLFTGRPHPPMSANPGMLHYGDPPAHGCVGDTMNCEDLEVVEFWQRADFDWARCPNLEGKMPVLQGGHYEPGDVT